MRTMTICLLLALLIAPATAGTSAQAAEWCSQFDFTTGQHGWVLTYEANTYHGRYDELVGFRASIDGGTTYEFGRSIRLHRDFSGNVSEITIYATTPNHDIILVDTDSAIIAPDVVNFRVELGTITNTMRFNTANVSGRLGLEIQLSVIGEHMTTTVQAIELRGYGSNPFGVTNCDLTVPANQIFAGIAGANALLNGLPSNLGAPSGVPVLPSVTKLGPLFGYVKGLTSTTSADEWAGPFGPIFGALGLTITSIATLVAVYAVIWAVAYAIRWAVWLFKLILAIITAIAAAVDLAIGWVFKLVKGLAG